MTRRRLLIEWLATFAVALLVAGWAGWSGASARLDNALLDRVLVRDGPASDNLVIVAIDERSLAQIGRWPWSRQRLADLVDRLHTAGAKAVGLDLLLSEPGAGDPALGAAIARAGTVALPWGFTMAEGRSGAFTPLPPAPAIMAGGPALGHVALRPDADGVVRRVPLQITLDGRTYPHLQLVLNRLASGKPPRLPTIDSPLLPLHPAGSYRTVPASAVLDGTLPAEFIAGKVVLVGASAAGLGDLYAVPAGAGGVMNGVEIQANLFQTLAADNFIRPAPDWVQLAFALIVLGVLFAGFWQLSPRGGLLLALGLAAIAPLLALGLASDLGRWLPPGPVLLALVLAYPLWGWRRLDAVGRFLAAKAGRLAPAAPPDNDAEGFDAVARAVGRLDFLIDAVAERRAFLQRVVEAAPDELCVLDGKGQVVLGNAGARALLGAALEGQPLDGLLASLGGQRSAGELVLADGRTFALSEGLSNAPEVGTALAELHILRLTEITAIRKAEAERRAMLEFLSHDMRGPQVAILGLAEGAGTADGLDRIGTLARRTLDLADNFVRLARLDHAAPECEMIDLAALADEAADRSWPQAKAAGVQVESRHDGEPVLLESDPQLLARVLDNLIGNAVKYAGHGAEVQIEVAALPHGGASLTVADNGPGLPESRRAEPFRRFGSTSGGSGLGLAFVMAAVHQLGGEVACTSGDGGTRFAITLPSGT